MRIGTHDLTRRSRVGNLNNNAKKRNDVLEHLFKRDRAAALDIS